MAKIKVKARDSTSALDEVSRKLGADAYILSTNSMEDGIEIEATNDVLDVKRKLVPKKSNFSTEIQRELGNVSKFPIHSDKKPTTSFGNYDPERNNNSIYKNELQEIKGDLEVIRDQIKGMFITDLSGLNVELSQSTMIKLTQAKFDPKVIKRFQSSFEGLTYERGRKAFMKALAEKLSGHPKKKKLTFIAGLSGVGKSTLVAKMAAQRTTENPSTSCVLASLNKEASCINESLRSYARMLNIPMLKLGEDTMVETLSSIKEDVVIDVSINLQDSLNTLMGAKEFWGSDTVEFILAINGGANQKIIKIQANLFAELTSQIAITKLDECEISSQEISEYIINDLKICYLSGSKSVVSDLAISNKEILEQYFIENC